MHRFPLSHIVPSLAVKMTQTKVFFVLHQLTDAQFVSTLETGVFNYLKFVHY